MEMLNDKSIKCEFENKYETFEKYLGRNEATRGLGINSNKLNRYDLAHEHAKEQAKSQNAFSTFEDDIFSSPFSKTGGCEENNMDFNKGVVDPTKLSGYEVLALLRTLLNMFEWEREENQVDFHEHFIATVLPKIFKKEWDTEYDKILRLFKKTKHDAETILICPRRWGKTVSVAMFCAAYILAVPDAEVAIFSTAKRTSGKMMMGVLKFMKELPLFDECELLVKNSETIQISLYGNVKTISCYPGTVAVCFFLFSFSFV